MDKTPKMNTFIICPLRDDLIEKCLETLYRYTEENTFYVIVVDQTVKGLDYKLRDRYKNLMIIRTPLTDVHHAGNLGFAKANNLAIQLVTTPYFTLVNDDIEFINKQWWQGVMDTFDLVSSQTPERPCMAVCPSTMKLPDWSVGLPSGQDFYIMPYKKEYSEEDYDFLMNEEHYVNEHLTVKPGSVIDGITFYCPVFDTRKFLDVGYLDESYYPGGADDYDYLCRGYMKGYRLVGTTLSWVYHHWSSTLNDEATKVTVDEALRMGDTATVWGKNQSGDNNLDIWGVKAPCGINMRTKDNITAVCPDHPEETYIIPEPKIILL